MSATVRMVVNGRPVECAPGTTIAAALLNAGITAFRHSVTGEPRAPVCGMGICLECTVTIDGRGHRRACMEEVAAGLQIRTHSPPASER